ncbi:MAG TPA: hypothetical protein VGG44_03900 [Tepidisphaeraceae bacterium]|jgi:hypothetical protein
MTNGYIARGKVTEARNATVIFQPLDTNYQLHLKSPKPYTGPIGQIISARIHAKAVKVYTVPSGGGFISPLFGPPKIIQGRAIQVDERMIVIRAGALISVELPAADEGVDLTDGPLAVGSIVNAVAMPGALFEWVSPGTLR